jgi:hypothetical protein
MSDRTELQDIWPTLGRGHTKRGDDKNISYTKSGPGRRHKTGKPKKAKE